MIQAEANALSVQILDEDHIGCTGHPGGTQRLYEAGRITRQQCVQSDCPPSLHGGLCRMGRNAFVT